MREQQPKTAPPTHPFNINLSKSEKNTHSLLGHGGSAPDEANLTVGDGR